MTKNKNKKFKLIINSNPKHIRKVEGFLETINKNVRLDELKFNKLLVATTEAVNNSIIHGNKRDPNKKVTISCEVNNTQLVIRVKDEGIGIDLSKIPNPLEEKNLLRENGRGIFLMRSLMDRIDFKILENGYEVIMTLKL